MVREKKKEEGNFRRAFRRRKFSLIIICFDDIEEFDDVGMFAELEKEHHFSECSL